MKAHKKLILFGTFCAALSVAGCSKGTSDMVIEPSDQYDSAWSYDQDHHFKKSLEKGDDSVIDYNDHYLDEERKDEDGYLYSDCIVCGYRRYVTPVEGKFELAETKEVVYPYVEQVKNYLIGQSTSPEEHLVVDYSNGIMTAEAPVKVTWTSDEKVDHFQVICSRNAEFKDSKEEPNKTYVIDKNERSVSLYNLYPDTTYYVKVTEVFLEESKEAKVLTTSIKTCDLNTRVIHVDGIKNVRDLGGYPTTLVEGKKTKQGMIYRGSALEDGQRQLSITSAGEETFLQELGIKTEIELRDNGTFTSPLAGKVTYKQLPIAVYNEVFNKNQKTTRQSYQELMELLADEKNYPVYIHCQQGDDRTGTVAFFLNALFGVSYNDLCIDYEMTSFSPSGLRGARNGMNYSNHFADIYSSTRTDEDGKLTYLGLMTYGKVKKTGEPTGETTLTQCAENFFQSLGVKKETIEKVRQINIEGYGKK